MSEHEHAFVSIAPCGCADAIAIDDGDGFYDSYVLEWIKRGDTVKRLPVREAKALFLSPGKCQHTPKWGRT